MGSKLKRTVKDSVFTDLFQDKKYLFQLYKALHPEDIHTTEDDISDITIKHVLVDGDYNDLGFSVGCHLMVIVESQSTWTYNIIVRELMYMVQTYHDYFKRTKQNLYGSKKVNMPKPELYVIYTGEKKEVPDVISLSKDFFDGEEIAIDVQVKVLHKESKKDIIGQYIIFSKVYNEQRKLHGITEKAIREAIRICKDKDVLKEYLESREMEVVDMMMTLFDDEYILETYINDIKEEAAKEAARQTATQMIRIGKMSLSEISECVPDISMEELKELEAGIMQVM